MFEWLKGLAMAKGNIELSPIDRKIGTIGVTTDF